MACDSRDADELAAGVFQRRNREGYPNVASILPDAFALEMPDAFTAANRCEYLVELCTAIRRDKNENDFPIISSAW
ncbi:MAG: hypothetical protein C4293_03950 [Nitrospiraceae bacterium]